MSGTDHAPSDEHDADQHDDHDDHVEPPPPEPASPAWLPLLVFSPFIADASVTLLKRVCRGEKVWQAHREHYYQRMVQHGLGHRNTALLAYILMLASGSSAMWATRQDPPIQFGVVIIWCAVYLTLMGASDHYWERRSGGS